jgi:hypothetical protein
MSSEFIFNFTIYDLQGGDLEFEFTLICHSATSSLPISPSIHARL